MRLNSATQWEDGTESTYFSGVKIKLVYNYSPDSPELKTYYELQLFFSGSRVIPFFALFSLGSWDISEILILHTILRK